MNTPNPSSTTERQPNASDVASVASNLQQTIAILLDDCMAVLDAADVDRMHLADLLECLALLRPDAYGKTNVGGLRFALYAAGVRTPRWIVRSVSLWGAAIANEDPDCEEVGGFVSDWRERPELVAITSQGEENLTAGLDHGNTASDLRKHR